MAVAIGLLFVGAISKNADYGTLLLGSMGVLVTVIGVILLASPLQYTSGYDEVTTYSYSSNSTINSTVSSLQNSYSTVSSAANLSLSLTLTIIGVFSSWVANLQRKDQKALSKEQSSDDGLGGFD